MPDEESWEKYGFPDDLMFRSPYLPGVGLCKAFNERVDAEGEINFAAAPVTRVDIPEYFTPYPGMGFQFMINVWNLAFYKYVNPEKVPTATRYMDCFWDANDLRSIAADNMDMNDLTNILRPEFSVKWALWIYNAINILRYVPTSTFGEWPTFTYEDRYDTFNFKAQEAQ